MQGGYHRKSGTNGRFVSQEFRGLELPVAFEVVRQRLLVRRNDAIAEPGGKQERRKGLFRCAHIHHHGFVGARHVHDSGYIRLGVAEWHLLELFAGFFPVDGFQNHLVRQPLRVHDCAVAIAQSDVSKPDVVSGLVPLPKAHDLLRQSPSHAAEAELDDGNRAHLSPLTSVFGRIIQDRNLSSKNFHTQRAPPAYDLTNLV